MRGLCILNYVPDCIPCIYDFPKHYTDMKESHIAQYTRILKPIFHLKGLFSFSSSELPSYNRFFFEILCRLPLVGVLVEPVFTYILRSSLIISQLSKIKIYIRRQNNQSKAQFSQENAYYRLDANGLTITTLSIYNTMDWVPALSPWLLLSSLLSRIYKIWFEAYHIVQIVIFSFDQSYRYSIVPSFQSVPVSNQLKFDSYLFLGIIKMWQTKWKDKKQKVSFFEWWFWCPSYSKCMRKTFLLWWVYIFLLKRSIFIVPWN